VPTNRSIDTIVQSIRLDESGVIASDRIAYVQHAETLILQNFGYVIPIRIPLSCGVSETKLLTIRMKDNINTFIPAHAPRKRNQALLTVNEPANRPTLPWDVDLVDVVLSPQC
jgi:hypothetical protein